MYEVHKPISIHALLAESDTLRATTCPTISEFLSTLSLRRATPSGGRTFEINLISIHALLAESDAHVIHGLLEPNHFYPRSPCGERPLYCPYGTTVSSISIHALLAESDDCFKWLSCYFSISIHALLAESDPQGCYTVT